MAKIITLPNKNLRKKSKPVLIDGKTYSLVKTLKETLTGTEGKMIGVGLAAVQIGIPKRIFLAYSDKSRKILTFINPEIIWYSKRLISLKKVKLEGCLSVPGRWAIVRRAKEVRVKYQTESGTEMVRKFSDILATVIQHEHDHLNGIVFIDRALEQKSKIFEMVTDEEGKENLVEIKINNC